MGIPQITYFGDDLEKEDQHVYKNDGCELKVKDVWTMSGMKKEASFTFGNGLVVTQSHVVKADILRFFKIS